MHAISSRLSPITRRRWAAFKANRRARVSLWLFGVLFIISLFAELIANDKPLVLSYRGDLHFPLTTFYTEEYFGGEFQTEPDYTDPLVKCFGPKQTPYERSRSTDCGVLWDCLGDSWRPSL